MKYNTPHKRRVLYRKSEQNRYDLEHKKNTQTNPKFASSIINAIQTLYDSDYKQKVAVGISQMSDNLSDFDNDDYDWLTAEEYANG